MLWSREPTQRTFGEGRRRRFPGGNPIPATVPPEYWRWHACTGRTNATRETPDDGCLTPPDAREGQVGSPGESERPVVPWKPGNAGGGKGPRFKANVRSSDSREIGDEPSTSTAGWEVAGDVACQSEEGTQLPLLRTVRQGVPGGCAALCLPLLPGQRRRCGHRWPDVRGYRGLRRAEVAG